MLDVELLTIAVEFIGEKLTELRIPKTQILPLLLKKKTFY
jgi:hypothetical protein